MSEIPVTFTFEGKEYSGILSEVSGAGAERGTIWHLYIGKRYWGQLLYLERGSIWLHGLTSFPLSF